MAEVTETITKKYKGWSHAQLVQEIADALATINQLNDELEEAKQDTEQAEESRDLAEDAAQDAEMERDEAVGERTALEDEVRWAEGMRRPEAAALRRSLEILQGRHPHTMTPLL